MAEVGEDDVVGEVVADQLGHGLRQQHLVGAGEGRGAGRPG